MVKRILSLILAVALLGVLALPAAALDTTRLGSISIEMKYDGNAVPGGELTIYRVAEISGMHYRYLSDYESCQVPPDDVTSAQLPTALAALVKTKELKGTAKTISALGKIKFSELETGLYLVIQSKAASGYNAVNPFMVTVPGVVNNVYVYDVDASPKLELEKAPTETTTPPTTTTTTTTTSGSLPQTGQTQWPVPVMVVLGVFLIAMGWYLSAPDKRKDHEGEAR